MKRPPRPKPRSGRGRTLRPAQALNPSPSAKPISEVPRAPASEDALRRAEEAQDYAAVESILSKRLDLASGQEGEAELGFKLGLVRLAALRDLEGAHNALRTAIRAGQDPFSRQARLSLAQLLFRTARPQQAAFELRKVAEGGEDLVAAQARALLVEVMRAMDRGAESERVRDAHKAALSRLARSDDASTAATAGFWLGMEHKHDGERTLAKAALERSLASEALSESERPLALAALSEL